DAGEILTDTHTFVASDGSTQVVTITINGSEDTPVITGTTTGSVTEDGTLSASGSLSFPDEASTLSDNGYGSFELASGTWTYTLNNAHASVQALDAGESLIDTYTITAGDGSTQTVTITIDGAEDAPVITGATRGSVTQDSSLTTDGTLSISDGDSSDNPISFPDEASTLGDNGYGDFALVSGTWTYTLNNAHSAVQALDADETLTDTHTFIASDGSTQVVMVTIKSASVTPIIDSVTNDRMLTTYPSAEVIVSVQESLNTVDTVIKNDGDVEDAIQFNTVNGESSHKSENEAFSEMDSLKVTYGEYALIPINGVMLADILDNIDIEQNKSPHHQKIQLEPTPLKTTDLRDLDINSFEQADGLVLEMQSLTKNISFVSALDEMVEDMDESLRENKEQNKVSTEVAIGATMSLSAGFVSWVLRAGSLMASFMSVIPMWKQLDPLPILGAAKRKKDEDGAVNEFSEDKMDAEVEEIFSQKRID
ncbi:MAG: VCBS domain-containing protein, partial [Candidatus Thiodiazotropha sp.]